MDGKGEPSTTSTRRKGSKTKSRKRSKTRSNEISDIELPLPESPLPEPVVLSSAQGDCFFLSDESDTEYGPPSDESFDPAKIGEEITNELLEHVRDVCTERFFNANAASFITLELRNTWLRIVEAQWLDEYKPEIGHLSADIFHGDLPPPPLPFDTWSRGTLEVLNPEQRKGDQTTISASGLKNQLNPSRLGVKPSSSKNARPPDDDFHNWAMHLDVEGEFSHIPQGPSLVTLYSQSLSGTKLIPEDGFNIPIHEYSPNFDLSHVPPSRSKIEGVDAPLEEGNEYVLIGEGDADDVIPSKILAFQQAIDRSLIKSTPSLPEEAETRKVQGSFAIDPHHITSHTKFKRSIATDPEVHLPITSQLTPHFSIIS